MPDDSVRQMVRASGRGPTMIKGLVPTLPERGKIKIGKKGAERTSSRGNQFQPPQKLDHFIVTTLQRGQDGNFLPDPDLMRRFGDKPTEIPVRLLYDDPALNFPTRYACFIGRTLWCSGDGEYATRLTDTPKQLSDKARAEPREVACPCHRQDPAYQGQDKCKMNGSLSVLIEGAGGIGGVWKFRTTSYNSIVSIMSSMAFLRSVTGGVLANIPLKLRVQPKQATAPHDGSPVQIYFVTLEFDGDIAGLQTIAHGIALDRAKTHVSIEHIEEEAKRLLALMPPANVPLPGDDADDVVEEFYPEQAREAWPQAVRHEPEPEPSRDVLPAVPSDVGYLVIDADGEEHEYTTPAGTAQAIGLVFRDAAKRGASHLEAAAENNRATLAAIAAGGCDVGELRAEYRELRTECDPLGLPPQGEPHSPAGSSTHSVPGPDVMQQQPAGEPDKAWLAAAAALAPRALDLAADEFDWQGYVETMVGMCRETDAATRGALKVTRVEALQLLRKMDGDGYRRVTEALAGRW